VELAMPTEITDEKQFVELAKKAHSCRIKKTETSVKLKLRTAGMLYTFKTTPENAEKLLKGLEIQKIEL
jgi:hypothetical protein